VFQQPCRRTPASPRLQCGELPPVIGQPCAALVEQDQSERPGARRTRALAGISPRKAHEYLFEDKPARTFERIAALADCRRARLRPRINPGCTSTAATFSSTAAPWVNRRTAIPALSSQCSRRATTASLRQSSERPTTPLPSRARCGRAARRARRQARRCGLIAPRHPSAPVSVGCYTGEGHLHRLLGSHRGATRGRAPRGRGRRRRHRRG
jgi:hypothetical protein